MIAMGLVQLWDWYYGSEDPIWHILFYLVIMPLVSLVFALTIGRAHDRHDKFKLALFPLYALLITSLVYLFMANGGVYFIRNPELSKDIWKEVLLTFLPSFVGALIGMIVNIYIDRSGRYKKGNTYSGYETAGDEREARDAGKKGEKAASNLFKRVLNKDDHLLNNVVIESDGKEAEYDNIIVNKYGIYVIEVKNYVGTLYGSENDFYWQKVKITHAGNEYEKTAKNPIPQVKRQVYVLSQFLKERGYKLWIKGYVFFVYSNSPVHNEYVLESSFDLEKAIHTKSDQYLDEKTIREIKKHLRSGR